jgi:sulfur relay (sulfurtransferase) DsrF/TusC family protein
MAGEDTGNKKVVLAMHSGTYGRTDDVYGALILANALLTLGMEVTFLLRGDGVFLALPDQRPNAIGFEPHLIYLESSVEMGAQVLALQGSMIERGLKKEELLEYVEVVGEEDLPGLMTEADHWMTF